MQTVDYCDRVGEFLHIGGKIFGSYIINVDFV